MSFKKILTSDGQPVIIGSTSDEVKKFPPGFSYRIGGLIYTVREDVTQDATSPMREVVLSDGTTEIMLVESIRRDLKEVDCEVLPPDARYAPRVIKEAKEVQKKTKKKTTKKKTKKKVKKNG